MPTRLLKSAPLILVLLLTSCQTKEIRSPEESKEPRAEGGGNTQEGRDHICTIQGNNNKQICVNPARPLAYGAADVGWPGPTEYLVDGPIEKLGAPSGKQSGDKRYPCGDWLDWLARQPSLYSVGVSIPVSLTAGKEEAIAIRDIEVRIFNRKPAPKHTIYIRCLFGAGEGLPTFIAEMDTRKSGARVFKHFMDTEYKFDYPMPPGAIPLTGQGFQFGQIFIKSRPYYLYDGMIIVHLIKNGKSDQRILGSRDRPLRWVSGGCPPEGKCIDLPKEAVPAFGWNGNKWVSGFNPWD